MAEVKGFLGTLEKTNDENKQLVAVGALFTLCSDEDSRAEIRDAGGVEMLVNLLDGTSIKVAKQSCGALLNLAVEDEGKDLIRDAGAIPKVLKLLDTRTQSKDASLLEYGSGFMLNMSADEVVQEQVLENEGVEIIHKLLSSDHNDETRKNAVGCFSSLCLNDGITRLLQKIDKFQSIVDMLDSEDQETLGRTSGTLWNLACAGPDISSDLAECGALEKLYDMLEVEDPELLGNSTMCISIMSSSPDVATRIRDNQMIGKIVSLMEHEDENVAQNAVGAVWNLGHENENRIILHQEDAISHVIRLLSSDSEEVIEKTLGALLTLAANETISADFREKGGFESLMVHLEPESRSTDKNTLYAIISFAVLAYEEKNKDAIRECGALQLLIDLLKTDNEQHLEKSTAAILNLTLNQGNRVAIRQLDGIAPLIELLFHPNANVQQNAAGALWNLSNDDKNKTVIRTLGGLKPLLTLIGGGKVAPKSKKDRQIDQDRLNAAKEEAQEEEEAQPEPEPEPSAGLEFDLNDGKEPEYKAPLDRDNQVRTTTAGNDEHGGDGLKPSALLKSAGVLDIKDRLLQKAREGKRDEELLRKRQEEEEAEREARRVEREQRELERKRQEEEQQRQRELELERERERIKKEEQERLEKEAKAEQERLDAQKKLDASIDWDKIYTQDDPFVPSTSRQDAVEKLQKALDEYKEIADPFSDQFANLNDAERKQVLDAIREFEDWLAKNPNASQEELDLKRRELDARIRPILSRASERNQLEQYAHQIKKRMDDEDDDFCDLLNDQDVDLINEATKNALDHLKDHPLITEDQLKEQLNKLKKTVQPVVDRAEKRDELTKAANQLRKRVHDPNDALSKHLSPEEKQALLDQADKVTQFLQDHPDATTQQLNDRHDQFLKNVTPLTSLAQAKDELDQRVNKLRDRSMTDKKLISKMRPDERGLVDEAILETLDWTNKNKNATHQQVQDKLKSLNKTAGDIVDRADAKSKLDDFARELRDHLDARDPQALGKWLTDMEKKQIKDASDHILDELMNKPNLTKSETDDLNKASRAIVDPLIANAQSRRDLYQRAQELRDRLQKDPSLSTLTPQEKKILNDAAQETLDWFQKSNGNKATSKQVRDKDKEYQDKVNGVLNNHSKHLELQNKAQSLRDAINGGKLANKCTAKEKKIIDDEAQQVLAYCKKNKTDLDKKNRELDRAVQQVLASANARQDAKQYVDDLINKMYNHPDDPLYKHLNAQEKDQIKAAVDEFNQWLKDHPDATSDQIEAQRRKLQDQIDKIINRALERNQLDGYAHHIKKRVDDQDDDLFELSPEEREHIRDAAQRALDQIQSHPDLSTCDQIKKELDNNTQPLLQLAKNKRKLSQKIEQIRKELSSQDVMNDQDKKVLQSLVDQGEAFMNKLPTYKHVPPPEQLQLASQQVLDKIHELENKSKEFVHNAKAIQELDQRAHDLRSRLRNDPQLLERLTQKEKKVVDDAVDETLSWIQKNPNSKAKQITGELDQLNALTLPIISDGEARDALNQTAEALSKDLVPRLLANDRITAQEADRINKAAQSVKDWLGNNPSANKQQIKQRRDELEQSIKPIMDKVNKVEQLLNDANQYKDLNDYYSPQESKIVEEACKQSKDWLQNNKAATADQVEQQRNQLKNKVQPSHEAAKNRRELENKVNDIMDKMAVDTRLSDAEKKQIKEALEPSKEFLKKHLPSKDTIAEMNALDKRIAPILERSQKLNKLENAADQLKRRLDRDVNLSDSSKVTTPQERETINKAIQKARDYVKNNIGKQTPMDQIAQQDAELQKAVDPILSRLDARNALHDYIDNANRSINNDDHHLSPSDQSLIKNACEESNKWSRANPRADKQQLDQQLNQLKNKVRPIMDQSLKKKDLLQLADSLQQKGQEGSGGGSDLTSDERRLLSDHARHIKDWLNDNPNADARELDKQLRHSKSKTDPIANRADQRDQLTSQCNQLRNALRNDRLAKHISHQDKNILQDMIDETVDYLNRNKNKSTKDLKQKKDALEAASRNILEKARAHQALDDYIDQTADKLKQLSNRISPMDQVKVNKALEQAKQFNKGADANDARDKLSQLKNQVDHVINRAQRDQELHDKVNHLVDRVNDKNDALHKQLTPKQFNQIVDQVQKQQDWINGPSHKQADADQLQNRIQDFDKSVMPLVQKADSKQALDKYISDSKQSLSKAEMDPQESKKLSDALDGAKQWLKAHPDVNKRDYDDKKSQVQAQVQPSLDRSKERSDLINYASNIREKVSTDPQLASLLNADDKKLIDNRANETIDWVKRTPDAKLNQIKEKKKALENTVNAVLESKDERNNLLDYAKKVLDVLNNNQAVRKAMTDKEQQAVDDYAQSVLDWLASNPNATANQIRDLKKSLEDNLAKVKNFKFVVPYKTFVGFRFNEQTRWGISGNRSTDIVYGSYLQQQERRDKEAAAKRGAKVATSTAAPKPSTGEKKFKVAAKSKYSIPTKQEEEDLKLFQTLKGSKGGLIQAKLSSLIDTTGRVKAEFGAVVDDQPQQSSSSNATTYSYAQLKNGAKYPPGIDTQKREQYLSDAEFVKLFNMTKSEFNRMPNFKQISTKKALELFQYEYQK